MGASDVPEQTLARKVLRTDRREEGRVPFSWQVSPLPRTLPLAAVLSRPASKALGESPTSRRGEGEPRPDLSLAPRRGAPRAAAATHTPCKVTDRGIRGSVVLQGGEDTEGILEVWTGSV